MSSVKAGVAISVYFKTVNCFEIPDDDVKPSHEGKPQLRKTTGKAAYIEMCTL